MRWGVAVFPGSCDDDDVAHCLGRVLGQDVRTLWHKDPFPGGCDGVVLPGGFSYGDYLRAGAMARFAPVMQGIVEFAEAGGLVLGICNGFQILCESGLLPGTLTRNASLRFVCRRVFLRVEDNRSPFTRLARPGELLDMPVKHGEGRYYADAATLKQLDDNGQVLLRYADAAGKVCEEANPNGSVDGIAGVCNRERNVFGLMPHPEDATEPVLGGVSGLKIFSSMVAEIRRGSAA